jgi:hypothetical protein
MDVCLPEEFLRLNGADETAHDDARRDDWLGGEAWVSGVPQRAPRTPRRAERDDPTWLVT